MHDGGKMSKGDGGVGLKFKSNCEGALKNRVRDMWALKMSNVTDDKQCSICMHVCVRVCDTCICELVQTQHGQGGKGSPANISWHSRSGELLWTGENKRQRMRCSVPGNLLALGAAPHLCPHGKQEDYGKSGSERDGMTRKRGKDEWWVMDKKVLNGRMVQIYAFAVYVSSAVYPWSQLSFRFSTRMYCVSKHVYYYYHRGFISHSSW